MTNKDISAFPCGLEDGRMEPLYHGMTLRDYFAAKAMQGMFAANPEATAEVIAKIAYQQADAMLRERDQ